MCATHVRAEPACMTSTNDQANRPDDRNRRQRDARRLADAAELRRQTTELLARLERLIARLQPAELQNLEPTTDAAEPSRIALSSAPVSNSASDTALAEPRSPARIEASRAGQPSAFEIADRVRGFRWRRRAWSISRIVAIDTPDFDARSNWVRPNSAMRSLSARAAANHPSPAEASPTEIKRSAGANPIRANHLKTCLTVALVSANFSADADLARPSAAAPVRADAELARSTPAQLAAARAER